MRSCARAAFHVEAWLLLVWCVPWFIVISMCHAIVNIFEVFEKHIYTNAIGFLSFTCFVVSQEC